MMKSSSCIPLNFLQVSQNLIGNPINVSCHHGCNLVFVVIAIKQNILDDKEIPFIFLFSYFLDHVGIIISHQYHHQTLIPISSPESIGKSKIPNHLKNVMTSHQAFPCSLGNKAKWFWLPIVLFSRFPFSRCQHYPWFFTIPNFVCLQLLNQLSR